MAEPHQVPHGWMFGKVFTLLKDVIGEEWNGRHPVEENVTHRVLPTGSRVKVTVVSRFYDCGITDDLLREIGGYLARVDPGILLLDGREETPEEKVLKEETHQLYLQQQAAWDSLRDPEVERLPRID